MSETFDVAFRPRTEVVSLGPRVSWAAGELVAECSNNNPECPNCQASLGASHPVAFEIAISNHAPCLIGSVQTDDGSTHHYTLAAEEVIGLLMQAHINHVTGETLTEGGAA